MARLIPVSDPCRQLVPHLVSLRSPHLVGRGAGCHLRLPDPRVSAHHAELRYTEDGWILRDLGSRNGSWLGRQRIPRGSERGLQAGQEIAIGHPEIRLCLAEDSAPCAAAACGERLVEGRDGLLALGPDPQAPRVSIHRDPEGRWVAERGGEVQPLQDGQSIELAGESWVLSLPQRLPSTAAAPSVPAELQLHFAVSLDEEHVELSITHAGRRVQLRPRVHQYLLLTLARQRLEDAKRSDLPISAHGWVHQADLARDLRVDDAQINLQVFRARKQLGEEVGVRDPARLIERRSGARQLRIGSAALSIRRI